MAVRDVVAEHADRPQHGDRDLGRAPQVGGGEHVHLGQVAHLRIGAARVERERFVHVERVLGQRAVDVRAGPDDHVLDPVREREVEQPLGAVDVHLVAQRRVRLEVPHRGEVDDDVGPLAADDVLELALAQVGERHADAARPALPRRAIDADDLVAALAAQQRARDELPLPAGDAGDEYLLHARGLYCIGRHDENAMGGSCRQRRQRRAAGGRGLARATEG